MSTRLSTINERLRKRPLSLLPVLALFGSAVLSDLRPECTPKRKSVQSLFADEEPRRLWREACDECSIIIEAQSGWQSA
jgi:hypothetical protein